MGDVPGTNKFNYLHGDKMLKFWNDFYDHHEWLPGEKMNIYIDFPYCVSNCKYCMIQPANYNVHNKEIPIYEEKLLERIREQSHLFPKHQIGQIAFGGGTASLLSRDTLREIMKIFGPCWDGAYVRKMEVHPRDLSDEYISFLLDEVHITNMSIGVQSFNPQSNRDQQRIMCDINDLIRYVDRLQTNGVSMNMDLVALFNGETERDWEIFRDDMRIVREIFNPDMFFTQVNFATQKHYYEHTLRLRKEIIDFISKATEYEFPEDRYYKLDIDDVQDYLDTTYFMVKPDYFKYICDNNLYKQDPRYGNYMGFGGNLQHRVFSLTSEGDTIYSYYDFHEKRWIHEMMETEIPKVVKGVVPTIPVGQYIIPPYDPNDSLGFVDENGKLKEVSEWPILR